MRPDARASLSMNAREAPLCGLAFNEGVVKSSKCCVDVSGEENWGARRWQQVGSRLGEEKGRTRETKSNRQRE